MDDLALKVCVIERLADAGEPFGHLLGGEDSVVRGGTQFGKRFAIHKFHRNGGLVLIIHKVVDSHDVRMGKLKTATRLGFEFFDRCRIETDEAGEKLQSHRPLQL